MTVTVKRLSVQGATKCFGGLQALSDVCLEIEAGQIYGLIGPNGAGKTTFFNVLTGLYVPDGGTFRLDGKVYSPSSVSKVARAGIARTFQNIRLFSGMSTLENVMIGRHVRTSHGFLSAILQTPSERREERDIRKRALELLDFVGIATYASATAGTLSYGHQRRLEIARALATEPLVLALDEPAAGMNPSEKLELSQLLQRIRSIGTTILLIEHDVKMVMGMCDQLTVLDYGRVIAQGSPAEVQSNPDVIRAYLGDGIAQQ
jgi:branched-chain amino acid transport system ATP-binding protein